MKKLPIVKQRRVENNKTYSFRLGDFEGFGMAWVSDPNMGRYQATSVMECREFLCACVRAYIYKNNYNAHFSTNDDAPIDMNKTRLLILNNGSDKLSKQEFKEKLFNGKALLNLYEKIGNFSSLSKISTINHEKYKKQWLITGPKEWMKAGQLISAMTFLLRLSVFSGPINTSNLNVAEDSFNEIIKIRSERKTADETIPNRYGNDVDLSLKCFWDKMWILAKFQNELFSDDFEKNYEGSLSDDSFGMRCGIRNLAVGTSSLPGRINEKFANLCEKYLPRKQ